MSVDRVFTNARLVDGTGAPVREHTGVVVRDGTVHAVGDMRSLRVPEGSQTIDVAGRTVMPGLIDAHTHLTYHSGEYGLLLQQMNETLEFNTVKAVENARQILMTGCTAVGDGGSRGNIAVAIREAVRRRVVDGPKVVAAGQMLTGSAGIQDHTQTWGYHDDAVYLGTVVNGPLEVRTAVRKQVRAGVDWVKVTASGTPGNPWINGRTQDLLYEEIRAAVEEAAKFGKLVHAHAHDPQGIREAARAGVVSLHSGEFADREGLETMKEHGCHLVATISWLGFRTNRTYVERYLRVYDTAEEHYDTFVEECRQGYESAREAVRLAYEIGTPLAIGSDAAHVFPPYDVALELECHQELGIPPLEVLKAATSGSAAAIGRAQTLGSVEPGKAADLLVVDGRPDEDVRVLRDKARISMIVQDGVIVKDTLRRPAHTAA